MDENLRWHQTRLKNLFPDFTLIKQSNDDYIFDKSIRFDTEAGKVSWAILGDKYSVSGGGWPTNIKGEVFYDRDSPSINIGVKRSDESIKLDFEKRFWSIFKPMWLQKKKEAEESSSNILKRRETLKELGEISGNPWDPKKPDSLWTYGYGIWNLDVNHDGSEASINLRYLPKEVIKNVIRLVRSQVNKDGKLVVEISH